MKVGRDALFATMNLAKAVRKNNFSNSFGNDQECLFFQGSVCYRPGTIAEVIFAHCLRRFA